MTLKHSCVGLFLLPPFLYPLSSPPSPAPLSSSLSPSPPSLSRSLCSLFLFCPPPLLLLYPFPYACFTSASRLFCLLLLSFFTISPSLVLLLFPCSVLSPSPSLLFPLALPLSLLFPHSPSLLYTPPFPLFIPLPILFAIPLLPPPSPSPSLSSSFPFPNPPSPNLFFPTRNPLEISLIKKIILYALPSQDPISPAETDPPLPPPQPPSPSRRKIDLILTCQKA